MSTVITDMGKETPEASTVHPQPTSDPLDPLNWSRLQKHTILGIVMLKQVPSPSAHSRSKQRLTKTKDASSSHT